MVNSQVTSEIVNEFKLDLNTDKIPQPIPVIEVGNKWCKDPRVITQSSTGTGSFTLLTASSTANTYLITVTLAYCKDAACDTATGGTILISIVTGGLTRTIIAHPTITLTAQSGYLSLTFEHPIKLDKGSNISVGGNFTAGVLVRTATAIYFYDEVL